MIVFKPKDNIQQHSHPYIILFGAGLAGKAVASKISEYASYDVQYYQSLWGQVDNLHNHKKMINKAIETLVSGQTLEIVWSAGKAGFNSMEQEIQDELDEFKAHLDFIKEAACSAGITVNFTLLSSAGGLFEGERLIKVDTSPVPKRPYGHLKLNMEKALENCPFNLTRIIRLTSIFGYIEGNQRRGLICTLIDNGLKGRTTSIYGNFNTLRDYIFVEDVASFVTQEIFSKTNKQGKQVIHLTGEKPCTIGEIIYLVEKALKHKVYLQWKLQPTNQAHISYTAQNKLANFKRTPLAVAIGKIYHNCLL